MPTGELWKIASLTFILLMPYYRRAKGHSRADAPEVPINEVKFTKE